MMRKIGLLTGILFLALALAAPQASAVRLFGTVSTGTASEPDTATLVEIDPDDGSLIATIGDTGYAVNGMTWDETTDTLYATTSSWDPVFPSGLLTIDPLTATATTVGTGAGQLVNVPASNSAGQLYGWTENSDDPVLWNKAAGTVTVLGESGIYTRGTGLAFDASDTLYLVNDYNHNGDGQSVYTINTTTGAATPVGALPSLPNGYAHHGDFHPVTNLYYGIDTAGGWEGVTARNLLVINIGTLTLTDTIPTVDNLQTLTFIPGDITLVKTVGTEPGVCAATREITVAPGTTVYYCYTVTNNSDQLTYSLHDLVDDQLGSIFSGLAYDLTPGSSINTVTAGLTISAVINETTTNTATWTAMVIDEETAVARATATVNVPPQSIPTLSEWGMIVMSLFLAGTAIWLIRRRLTA